MKLYTEAEAQYKELVAFAAVFGTFVNQMDVDRITSRFPDVGKDKVRRDIVEAAKRYAKL